jgi:alkylresorcinol/alkylpyrone synthase
MTGVDDRNSGGFPAKTSPSPETAGSAPGHPVRIRAVGRALPDHYASQEALIAVFRDAWAGAHFNPERLEELHRTVRVDGRYLALPVAAYRDLTSFAARNDAWIRAAVDLGEVAVRRALDEAGLSPADVDHIVFVTTTGIATPSIDARLVNRLGLRRDVRRSPLFGLGCAAGAAGISRAWDLLAACPDQVAVLLSVELCSLTLQMGDLSIPNIISSGLFGDGAAAVVLTGGRRGNGGSRKGPAVVASRSSFYPDTEGVMGWDVVESGFKVVLSAKVPEVVREHVRSDVDGFLAMNGCDRSSVRYWIAHTGGPKVLRTFESALELPEGALARSWRSLKETGNLSSASVLFVLGDLLSSGEPAEGDLGLLMAMGPGFCSELVLLRW